MRRCWVSRAPACWIWRAGRGSTPAGSRGSGTNLDRPLLVNGFVVVRQGETRLCELLLESFPPQCGGASQIVDGYDPTLGRDLNEEAGVSRSGGPVQLLGTIDGEQLVVSTLSR